MDNINKLKIPNEITSETNIAVYVPTVGEDIKTLYDNFDCNKNNSILVVLETSPGSPQSNPNNVSNQANNVRNYVENGLNIVDKLTNDYNLNNPKVEWCGGSARTYTATTLAISSKNRGYDSSLALIDPVTTSDDAQFDYHHIYQVDDQGNWKQMNSLDDLNNAMADMNIALIGARNNNDDRTAVGSVKNTALYLDKANVLNIIPSDIRNNWWNNQPFTATHSKTYNEAFINNLFGYLLTGNIDNADLKKYIIEKANNGEWVDVSSQEFLELLNNSGITIDPFSNYKKLGNLQELQCSNEFIGSKINNIRNSIKNTNFLTSTSFNSYNSTTNIPNGEIDLIQSYFMACADLLNYIEKDTVKLIQIGNSIKELNKELEQDASNLNDSLSYYSSNGNNSSYNKGSYITGTTGAILGGLSSNLVSQLNEKEKTSNIKNEFLEYNDLYSDNEKIVYQKDNDYKIVIHYENDKILTLEYYFDYKTEEAAKEAMKTMTSKFEGIENTINNGQYVKVIFNEDVYKGLSLKELKKMYEDLKELTK